LAKQRCNQIEGQIVIIDLEAKALSDEKGYLTLGYEFVGFHEYNEEKKNQESKVF